MLSDSLVVIDFVSFTAIASSSDENWVLTILDDTVTEIFRIDQTVTATQADNIFLQFPSGFPMFNTATVSTTTTQNRVPCSSGYSVSVSGAVGTGYLSIGWHMELPGDRTR